MKRLCLILLSLALLTVSLTLSVPAADYTTDASLWADVSLRALYIQDELKLSSDVNPNFSADWPLYRIPEANDTVTTCTVNMRGFAISPNGRYTYMGVQHGGGDIVRGMFVMETMTGKILDFYHRYDGDVCNMAVPFSYPKGIAADSRGYVYVGFTLSASYNAAYLSIARQNNDGTLTEVVEIPVCDLGAPGNKTGIKAGINGVDIVERDGRVYCYVVTNYEHDALYCFDVTDPQNPVLCSNFGKSGVLMLSAESIDLSGYALDEALYLDVASDGTVYLCINATDGRDGVAVISPDGGICHRIMELDEVYCTELVGDFLLCGTRTSGEVAVLALDSGDRVATLSTADGYGERITRLQIVQDVLFVCDAGSVAGDSNAVYTAVLSKMGQAFLEDIVTAQNNGYAVYETETEAFTETISLTDVETVPETARDTEATSETSQESDLITEALPETVTTTSAETSETTALVPETIRETLQDTTVSTRSETVLATPGTTADETGLPTTGNDSPTVPDTGCVSAIASAGIILVVAAAIALRKKL